MVVYNFVCSGLSLYSLTYILKTYATNGVESLFKMGDDDMIKHAMFVYWVTKNIELLDTIFMILRHKQRQISFLHVSMKHFKKIS
jgi:elongation of very long chain fatty acids protein 4